MSIHPNETVETNRRPAFPLGAGRQFGSTSCAPPSLPAAVAHLYLRWAVSSAMQITKRCLALAALCLCVSGCATDQFKAGSGDVSKLILERAVASGASPVSTNTISAVGSRWRYFEDDHGVVIRMAQTEYPALESFLIQTFGQPMKGPNDTPDGGKYGVYRFTSKGGVLQFGRDSVDGTHVEIIRPLTKQESTDAIAKALKEKQVQKALSGSP